MKEQHLAGVQSEERTKYIRVDRETQSEARDARASYLAYLEEKLDMPPYIRDGLLEEYLEPTVRSKTIENWNISESFKSDQVNLLYKILGSGTFLGLGYVPYGSDIVDGKNGLSCTINKKIVQETRLILGDNALTIPLRKRRDKPYNLSEVSHEDENESMDVDMQPNLPYSLERAEADIIDTQLR